MALLHFDGFDEYGFKTSSSGGGPSNFLMYGGLPVVAPGRNNYGQAAAGGLSSALRVPAAGKFFMGAAFAANGGLAAGPSFVLSAPGQFSGQIGVQTQWDGGQNRFLIYDAHGTIVASSPNNTVNFGVLNSYYFVEFGATIATGTGYAEVRINGLTVCSASNIDTAPEGGSDGLIHNLSVGAGNPTATIDDFYLCDGTQGPGSFPCDTFLGDIRVFTLYPVGFDQQQWTPGTLPLGNTNDDGILQIAANSVVTTQSIIPAETGRLSKITVGFQPGFTGNVRAGLYSNTGAGAGSLLAITTAVANPAGGYVDFTFSVLPHVQAGTSYYLAVQTDTAYQALYTQGGGTNYAQSSAYAGGLPATLAAAATGTQPISAWGTIVPDNVNWQQVDERVIDFDISYNASNTPGQEDRFNFEALQRTTTYMIGVRPVGAYRKDDAGPRLVANVLKSGATRVLGATFIVPDAYQHTGDVFPVDPNTGASWTIAAINGLKAGYTLVS